MESNFDKYVVTWALGVPQPGPCGALCVCTCANLLAWNRMRVAQTAPKDRHPSYFFVPGPRLILRPFRLIPFDVPSSCCFFWNFFITPGPLLGPEYFLGLRTSVLKSVATFSTPNSAGMYVAFRLQDRDRDRNNDGGTTLLDRDLDRARASDRALETD